MQARYGSGSSANSGAAGGAAGAGPLEPEPELLAVAPQKTRPLRPEHATPSAMVGKQQRARRCNTTAILLALLAAAGCGKSGSAPALSRSESLEVPNVPVPPADGPRLGAIAHTTPVREAPNRQAPLVGYLHAGATVARAVDPYSKEDCAGGWYAIRPRGFVCLDEGASLDLRHPTLSAMAIQPDLDSAMPYTYARTKSDVTVYEVDSSKARAVKTAGEMTSRSGVAVVGSWEAEDEAGQPRRLAMLTDGRFIDAAELERSKFSEFQGVELGGQYSLPVAFIVKRGISAWDISGPTLERKRRLEYHQVVALEGRFRTSHDEKFWQTTDGDWVRHRDITAARLREDFPAFVREGRRWIDVSVIAGTAVAYEGTVPVYATLVSVGADRLNDELPDARVTERGEFAVVSKHITALNAKPKGFANRVEMHDVPWVLELASGQLLHASFWHDRFGIEHGPGNLQLSPGDARHLFGWAGPSVPSGWHATLDLPADESSTIVNIRK